MDLSNRVPENGSTPKTASVLVHHKPRLNLFDLVKTGLSSTLAIIVFIGIGHVVKCVAGPSAILSILIAALIAYLVGTFYTELNRMIVLSTIEESAQLSRVVATVSDETIVGQIDNNAYVTRTRYRVAIEWLLPSYELVYVCNGEFAAFVIAWNLIMEYVVIVALISKTLIIMIDALFFDSVGHLTEIIPMSWYLGEHFDVLALLVPIIIGVPLLLLLGRNTIFNVVSIALSLLIVLIFLFFGIFNADISNWDRGNGYSNLETGGFYAFGVDGVFKGVVIILFMFIAFDTMLLSRWAQSFCFSTRYSSDTEPVSIEYFTKTVNQAILSINTIILLCLLGMTFALTTIQPIYSMDKSLPLLSVIDAVFSDSNGLSNAATVTKFIILIAGSIALVGSLYAMLHAEQRVVQTMLSTDADDSTFKLFGKFGLNHLQQEIRQQKTTATEHNGNQRRRWETGACLLFSILSGLLAGLFAIEHLINLLSIGTLLMLFALTIDIMILRYSGRLKQQHPCENGTSATVTKSTRSISLVTILLSAYCLLAATLAILIKIVISKAVTISMTLCWIFISILIVSLLVIVLVLGAQPKGNAIFSLNLSHPLLPAIVLFGCIFLFTAIDVAAWIRLAIWMTIGILLYFISKKQKKNHKWTANGVTNDAFTSEMEINQNNFANAMTISNETIKLNDNSSIQSQDATILNRSPNEIPPKKADVKTFETDSVEFELEEVTKSPIEEFDVNRTEIKAIPKTSPPQIDHSKLNEISSVDDIKHMCVERREPNGTAYFVEVDLVQSGMENEMKNCEVTAKDIENIGENTEELEKNIVERVFNQNDIELWPKPEPKLIILSAASEFENSETEEEEKEVRAIVHASNEHSSPFELLDSTSIESSIPFKHSSSFECLTPNKMVTSPGVIRPIGVYEKPRRSPNFQIGVYEALPRQKLLYENDKDRLAFKMRLENLFGQSDEIAATPNRAKSNFSSPIQPHSMRLSTLNHSISAPESLHDETVSNGLPPKEVPSKIPIPPAFNQELYDTVGRRNRKAFPSAFDVIDVDGTIKDRMPFESVNKKANLSRTKAHDNLTELGGVENNAPPNIKQKLEEIFSKGLAATQLDVPVDFEANRNGNNENIRRSKRLEPFDTVRKQKMLFSDVLKSIGPDIHSNLHPTHTTAAIDIQETQRRESLD
ncbi:uncharacterized protein LOC129568229 [Sitodiplosis mosellana]|uniref:uncharacterized protein LOC129568229 n=1 Tax=Sitodiplosis mosellana TaxID=263140 RepID=UPI002443FC11|nr:uncharacterized protein LOC129568229 [Sitodiplosis mosellana]XP_055301855.1 uncharacterized protein LOC129568229 [Sitodiplosis mosellana]